MRLLSHARLFSIEIHFVIISGSTMRILMAILINATIYAVIERFTFYFQFSMQ